MASATGATERTARWDLDLQRTFDAPRAMVWKAWTDPAHLARWWGPHGFTNPVCEADVRPGGSLRIVMRGPDGGEHAMMGIFHEVVPPERLVFTSTVDDGARVHFDVRTTVTFADLAGRTLLTLEARVVHATDAAASYLVGMEQGWTQSLERLGSFLATLLSA
jgi:uncharacterized protein YndB with AHSA1/START domain